MQSASPSPLAQTIDHGREVGMSLVRISAAASVTIGLNALARNPGPISLEQLDDWKALLNQIHTSRGNPAEGLTLIVHEDGPPG